MSQAWLLVTCGLPFSGKSTLARGISDRTGFARISVDDLIPEIALMDRDVIPSESWRDAYLCALRSTEDHLRRGQSVVFDSVGHTRKNRYRLRRLAERTGSNYMVIHLSVAREMALERLLGNQAHPVRPNVPIDGFDAIARDFEPPDSSEPVLAYSPDSKADDWINDRLLPYLNGD